MFDFVRVSTTVFRLVSDFICGVGVRLARFAALVIFLSVLLARTDAHFEAYAHSASVGYVVGANNTVTVWYGTYHTGANTPEGIISIVGPVIRAQASDTVVSTKPAGLIDGTNNFRATSCGGLNPNQTLYRWQSTTFSNVPSGTYSITLTGSFSQNWQPCNAAISSPTSTFTFDTSLPVISGMPADIVQNTDPGQATAAVTWTPPTASDDVAIASFTSTHNPGDDFPVGVTTVTYTAQDTSGGTTTASFTVTVNDNEDPVVAAPADQVIEATGPVGAVANFAPSSSDNVGVVSENTSHASGTEFPLGTTVVTITATDAAGNSGTGTFNITVVDTTAPTISASNVAVTTDAGQATVAVTFSASASDAVGVSSLTYSPASGSTFPVGVTTVTATASDAAGNTRSETFTVTVSDDEAPVVTVPANITVNTDPGSDTASVTYATSANDNVDGALAPTLTAGPASGGAFPLGTTTVTYQATDAAGNVGTSTFTVTVNDNEDPTPVSVPADITQSAPTGSGTAVVNYATPTFADNVGVVSVVRTSGPASGAAFPVGATVVSHTATDAAGNSYTASFTVTVTDDEPPVVTVPANISVSTDPGVGTAAVSYSVSANDNVDGALTPTRTAGLASGAAFPVGVTTVTFQATDSAGNSASASFTVTVSDDEAPVVTVPANTTVSTDAGSATAVVSYATSANDNADGALTPVLVAGLTSGAAFPIGTTTVTYEATDAAGNTGSASFTVTVVDGELPVVTVPADIVVNTDPGSATAVVGYSVSAHDNGDGPLTPTRRAGLASGAAFPVGTTTVTYEATDSAGNTATRSFTVTVQDAERPVITLPANITVATDPGSNTAVVNYGATATDNVDGSITPTMTAGLASGAAFPVGTTTVTYQATDAAGNTSTQSFTVTVTDNEAPTVVSVPSDITQNTDPGQDTAVVSYPLPTFADNVGVVSVVRSDGLASGAAFPVGVTTVTHVATDADGNSVSATFTVTVVDQEAPVIAVPADITVSTDAGLDTAVVQYAISATDNYGVASLVSSPPTGSTFPIGVTVVTITAVDDAGNTSTATFNVTVVDNEPPVLGNIPADIVVTVDYPATSAPVTFATPTISDNASGASVSQTGGFPSGSHYPLGTTVVTFEGRDAAGNVVTASFNVTVRQTPPGEIRLVVVSDVNDGTFRFASTEPQLTLDVTTTAGHGQSPAINIRPGSYPVTATAPDGFGFVSVSCSDSDSVANTSAGQVTINLQTSEAVTCTFHTADSRTKTSEAIGNFLRRRNDLLLSSEHDWDRQIDRLARRNSGGGAPASSDTVNLSGFGSRLGEDHGAVGMAAAGFGRKLPGAMSLSTNGGLSASFSSSMAELQGFAANTEKRRVMTLLGEEAYKSLGADQLVGNNTSSDFDIWTEGRFTKYDNESASGASSGHFGLVYLGADYIVNPSVLLGMVAQYDDTRDSSNADSTSIHGRGWMVGPYATIKLAPSLYFQGRAAWGKSSNEISPFNTYTDTFETERWLVRGRLQGRWTHDAWTFSPSASFAYMEEKQEAYTDSLNVLIPEQKATLGQAEFGPEVSYTFNTGNGSQIVPSVSLKGVWNFAEENATTLADNAGDDKDIRAKVEGGLKFVGEDGLTFEISGTYDGIGDPDYEAFSGNARLHIPLN